MSDRSPTIPISGRPGHHVVSNWADAVTAYRSLDLRQALFDDSVIMDNVLINLHETEHRDRRRLESPLFRRSQLWAYERDEFPNVVATTLQPHLEARRCELLSFGHRVMLNLSCINAGIDRDLANPEQTERLLRLLDEFIEGARIHHYRGDRAAKMAAIADALNDFETEFVAPSLERRRTLLAAEPGRVPDDVLTLLADRTSLPADTMVREVAFYLTAGASTSAITLANTFHNIFHHVDPLPGGRKRLLEDAAFLRRCIQETLRLSPISPIGGRRATRESQLPDGRQVADGDRVDIDITAANRDPRIFGPSADRFDPDRVLPEGVPLHGLSFGHGAHRCLGADLAIGLDPDPQRLFEERLFGLIGVVARELLLLGVLPDSDDPPELEPTTVRRAFRRFPVTFASSP